VKYDDEEVFSQEEFIMNNKCVVAGCTRVAAVKKHQLCKAHLNRFYRTGEVGKGKILKKKIHTPYTEQIGEDEQNSEVAG